MSCELCASPGGTVLWDDALCRVVHIDEAGYVGYCRVVWNQHVKEMTDLTASERAHLLHVVFTVETVLRALLKPDKMNLASLGNITPHLHWHVIPRFADDPHFPQSIWSEPERAPTPQRKADMQKVAAALTMTLDKVGAAAVRR
jgi:diadenosine tetraphosphate (Ap4A) HIT family hydrolase